MSVLWRGRTAAIVRGATTGEFIIDLPAGWIYHYMFERLVGDVDALVVTGHTVTAEGITTTSAELPPWWIGVALPAPVQLSVRVQNTGPQDVAAALIIYMDEAR